MDAELILPPATIGMVGGGQLGRMFAIAAMSMGYEVVIYCDDANSPAAQIANRTVIGGLHDFDRVTEFAKQCDVITLEFENISAETIAKCSEFAPTYPEANVLATAQDRLIEKTILSNGGLAVTPFLEVNDRDSANRAIETLGLPIIVKTARSGYDGKGQYRIDSASQIADVPWDSADGWIAERCIAFEKEVSVIVARSSSGETKCFPVFENDHQHHILDISTIPAEISDAVAQQARETAISAAELLNVVGLLCVEFFVVGDGRVLINEIAPRPHNSGHLTIEALHTSQFQQHVRAVCGLPLGDVGLVSGGAAMANLLGDLWSDDGSPPQWDKIVAVPGVHLHLYGKDAAKPGRKMGHVTSRADSVSEALERVQQARDAIR